MKQVFDDPAVDAVVIATAGSLACAATIGRVRLARTSMLRNRLVITLGKAGRWSTPPGDTQRIVQSGMQNRSAPYNIAAKEYIQNGRLGKVEFVRVYNQKPEQTSVRVMRLLLPRWIGTCERTGT